MEDNCVPCCKHCNYVKGDLSIGDFEIWTKRFVGKQNGNNKVQSLLINFKYCY